MSAFINFLNEYGLLSAIITGLASALGVVLKKIYDRTIGERIKDKIKREVAAQVVKFVEQVYKDLHGEEKLEKAIEAAAEMLNEKGITISELELRVLLESALAELNGAFNKTEVKEALDLEELLGPEVAQLVARVEADRAAGK
jgi:hypothetical protein